MSTEGKLFMRELLATGVNIDLNYYEEYDALIGQIKGYSVAVKENLAAGSYGCLFWVKKGGFTAVTTAEEYLQSLQKSNPEFLKKFMVNDTGVAVALNRTSDDFTNVNNLKRFIYDFTANLSLNYYENCCCECGSTKNLSIYDSDNAIAQACPSCGAKYVFIRACKSSAHAVTPVPAVSVQPESVPAEEKIEQLPFAEFGYKPEEKQEATVTEQLASVVEEEEFSLKEFEYNPEDKIEENETPVIKEEETVDLSSFMYDEKEQSEAPAVQKSLSVVNEEPVQNFDSLLYEEVKPEPEKPKSKLFEEAEREFAAEKARMAAEEAKISEEVDNLLIENGEFVLKEITPENDDGSNDVTEVYDDSNDGEDFDIEEIESTVEMPTVTTGHPQLQAEETPLEADGSVPLINPNSHREERHVSAVDGPDAVQPLDYGQAHITYEKLSDETAPRFSAGGEINRNPVAPPPYNPQNNYASYTKPVSFADSSNAVMGIIGALVCGFLGLAIWIIIAHFLDIISVWGCLAIIFTVYGGYYLGGRALDKKGIVISFVLTLVMVFAGVVGMSVFDIMAYFKEEYDVTLNFMQAFNWTMESLGVESMRTAFISNLTVSMIATFIGNIVTAINYWRKA